jgi:hypothetical protein
MSHVISLLIKWLCDRGKSPLVCSLVPFPVASSGSCWAGQLHKRAHTPWHGPDMSDSISRRRLSGNSKPEGLGEEKAAEALGAAGMRSAGAAGRRSWTRVGRTSCKAQRHARGDGRELLVSDPLGVLTNQAQDGEEVQPIKRTRRPSTRYATKEWTT